ncbi:MAG TPA: hypothetical protein VFJ30_07625 [Phycisphaerae bacterium]|nr:hypothetical protein [Phycisphaerae bacterium]
MPDDTSQPTRSELFQHMATSPHMWFAEGAGLMRAAYVVWSCHQRRRDDEAGWYSGELSEDNLVDISTDRFVSSYMLLAGFAIENAVKGLIISKQDAPVSLQRLPDEVRSHDLKALFATAEIQLDVREKLLVEALQEATIWKGRYHTPLDMNSIDGTYPWVDYGKRFYHPTDVRDLFDRVIAAYPEDVWEAVGELAMQFPTSPGEWLAFVDRECPECPP